MDTAHATTPQKQLVDNDRFDRQVHAIGASAMGRLLHGTFAFVGLSPVGVEVARNIVLGGCKCILLCDDGVVSPDDVASNFLLSKHDVGATRSAALAPRINALNPRIHVVCVKETSLLDLLLHNAAPPDVVVASNIGCVGSYTLHLRGILSQCQQQHHRTDSVGARPLRTTRFIAVRCLNMAGAFCSDFGPEFVVEDLLGHQEGDAPAALALGVSRVGPVADASGTWDITLDRSSGNRALVDLLSTGMHDMMLFASDAVVGRFRIVSTTTRSGAAAGSANGGGAPVVTFRVQASAAPSGGESDGDVLLDAWDPSTPHYDASRALFVKSRSVPTTIAFDRMPSTSQWATSGRACSGLMGGCGDNRLALALLDACHDADNCASEAALCATLEAFRRDHQRRTQNNERDRPCADSADAMRLVEAFCRCPLRTFYPVAAIVGGIVAQEAIKAVTRHLIPETDLWSFDCRWLTGAVGDSSRSPLSAYPGAVSAAPHTTDDAVHVQEGNTDTLDDVLALLFGIDGWTRLRDARLFVVGAGAIGCEYLRAFAAIGIGSGKLGRVDVTDPDHIEVSNLSRQTLFSDDDVSKSKSAVAVAKAKSRCRQLKARSFARQVNAETSSAIGVFGAEFFRTVDVICGAVDNDVARLLLDELCGRYEIPMVDSGTLGVQGHVVAVLPHRTLRLSSSGGPAAAAEQSASGNASASTTAIPFCTLHFFPTNMLHCVQWAADCFAAGFTRPSSVPPVLIGEAADDDKGSQQGDGCGATMRLDRRALEAQLARLPTKAERMRLLHELNECVLFAVAWAEDPALAVVTKVRGMFERLFVHTTRQLLVDQPLFVHAEGKDNKVVPNPFWSARDHRIPPLEQAFDHNNTHHMTFVTSGVALLIQRCTTCAESAALLLEDVLSRLDVLLATAQTGVPDFVPQPRRTHPTRPTATAVPGPDGTQDATEERGSTVVVDDEDASARHGQGGLHVDDDDNTARRLVNQLSTSLHRLAGVTSALSGTSPTSERRLIAFDKDEASGTHVAFVAAAANIRASIYRIPQASAMDVKRIAGRIVPALITTTSVVTNFAVLQLVGLLLGGGRSLGASVDPGPSQHLNVRSIRDLNLSLQCLANSFLMECSYRTCLWTNPSTGCDVTPWTRWVVPLKDTGDSVTIGDVLKEVSSLFGVVVTQLIDTVTANSIYDAMLDGSVDVCGGDGSVAASAPSAAVDGSHNVASFPLLPFVQLMWDKAGAGNTAPLANGAELKGSGVVRLQTGETVRRQLPTLVVIAEKTLKRGRR